MRPGGDFRGVGRFEEELYRLTQIRRGIHNGIALPGHVELGAESDAAAVFAVNRRVSLIGFLPDSSAYCRIDLDQRRGEPAFERSTRRTPSARTLQ